MTRPTWVSTGIAGSPRLKSSTHAAVFGPMPFMLVSHAFASSSGIPARKLRSVSPCLATTSSSTAWIRGPFRFARPPERIASITSSVAASRTCCHVGKRSRSVVIERDVLMSDVFWDRIVPISCEIGSRLVRRTRGPYVASRSRSIFSNLSMTSSVMGIGDCCIRFPVGCQAPVVYSRSLRGMREATPEHDLPSPQHHNPDLDALAS